MKVRISGDVGEVRRGWGVQIDKMVRFRGVRDGVEQEEARSGARRRKKQSKKKQEAEQEEARNGARRSKKWSKKEQEAEQEARGEKNEKCEVRRTRLLQR